MLQYVNPVTDLDAAMLRVLVAALIGGLIGVERERNQGEQQEKAFAGARTFPLFAILGATLTLVSGGVGAAVIAGFLGLAALIVASYVKTKTAEHPGATTETAAFAAFWIGVMAGAGSLWLAGAIGVGTVVLLASKTRLDAFSRTLTHEELSATLTLAVLAAVILPVLPDEGLGPWGVWNPRHLWIVVVFVCGLSFVAFIGMRVFGASRGLYLTGLMGGLVSSTAATVSFATRSRESKGSEIELAVAAGIASGVMVLRIGVLVWVSNRGLVSPLVPFLAIMAAAGVATIAILARKQPGGAAPELSNPFQLKTALKFALIYAVVLLVVEGARRKFGSAGLMAAAVIAGLADVDAITLAFAGSASMAAEQAAGGIALAALSNTLAKAGYAGWFGRGRFRAATLLILGVTFLAGAAALVLFGPRSWSAQS